MKKIRASITGVGGYVPDYVLTNQELSEMVDTSDEWIMSRIGIKERRILKDEDKATSDMAAEAVKQLLEKTNSKPDDIDMLICGVVTPDMQFPATANIICDKVGIVNAFGYDINAGCSSFLFSLITASKFVETGNRKKVIVVGADKMSSITDYSDRKTCPIFGDGAGAVLLEPTTDEYGMHDSLMHVDGSGRKHLHQLAGGSLNPPSFETILRRQHYIYQEGQPVFKAAVSNMADVSIKIMKQYNLTPETLDWFVPHQANMRIIEATARMMGIKDKNKVMINIDKYGNTTSATIPLLLWGYENQLKKGDNLIISTFGAGFAWGATYIKWAYDGKR
ncbi:MAG: ketoacyl-ACP synthase III [Bacteroidales bacterium]|jgi:3-oxoacyl-[acyl-carrier-protein] synthase-3|nr:ketoacyl-ACP synthase III [Bacteroidales bacterium]MDD4234548.1 ketoacyl-ACP synthase III [Bacteroidales bacterium]MDY0159771.1 beta-ketoacyl-ACP synthase III [Bacteroidales bacterium]